MQKDKLIVANISGFYGDRLAAAREMLTGGAVDFLTGDYLAELTMAILYKAKLKNPQAGYARTFLLQMREVLSLCLEKGVKVVTNAGGLNPRGLAEALQQVASELNLSPRIAYIEGDDLLPRLAELQRVGVEFKHLDRDITLAATNMPAVSANAYLGCWGIVEALKQGADIVVTGRVADTSLVMAPAAYYFQWQRDHWNRLAGAATAGHIIECSGQATGGNYSYHEEVPTYKNLGFPLAEIYADGSSVITKQPNTGGLVSVGTVTAQLLYEVSTPAYITPDVVAHFDTIRIRQQAPDRVLIQDVRGAPATTTAKVTINCHGGFQNELTFLIAGLDIERKVEILKEIIRRQFGNPADSFDQLTFQYFPTHKDNPDSNEEALAQFRVLVTDREVQRAGKFFTAKIIETALCAPAGICLSQPPAPAKPRIVHFPTLIDKTYLQQRVTIGEQVTMVTETVPEEYFRGFELTNNSSQIPFANTITTTAYLGEICAARSGDKGGNANLGVWSKTPAAYDWLRYFLTVERLQELLPATAKCTVKRYEFPNLLGLNFYLIGFLGDGVAASTRLDGQAKTLGEYLRAQRVEIPTDLL